jgi:hypothetical protein
VLDFAEKRPHAPFFNGIIRPVEQSQSPGSDRQLASALSRYLDSPAVNERTDDDKSLILASRR